MVFMFWLPNGNSRMKFGEVVSLKLVDIGELKSVTSTRFFEQGYFVDNAFIFHAINIVNRTY